MKAKTSSARFDLLAVIAAVYATAVMFVYYFLHVSRGWPLVLLTLFTGVFAFVIMHLVLTFLQKRNWSSLRMKKKVPAAWWGAGAALLFSGLWLLAYHPGAFSPDSIVQLQQAISSEYVDWHPVWHTLVFFTVPLKLFGSYTAIVPVQLALFVLVMGYMAQTVEDLAGTAAAILSCAVILLNPYVSTLMLFPWKDIGFGLAALAATCAAIRMECLRTKPLRLWQTVLLGFVIASATLFRHNAVLYTAPLMAAMFFNTDRKTWIRILAFTLAFVLLIAGPLYSLLQVEKPDKRVVETMGLPLTVIGNVVTKTPELMDEELSGFAYAIAPREQWESLYSTGNFNYFKWQGINDAVIEEQGISGMLRLMFKCFRLSPAASFEAFFALTDVVYGFTTGVEGNELPYLRGGITYTEPVKYGLQNFIRGYEDIIDSSPLVIFRTYGVALFAILAVFLAKINKTTWKKSLLLAPVFVYDFGTMLLLTGPDSRFFFVTFLVTPLLIFYMMCTGGKQEHRKKENRKKDNRKK